MTRTRGRIDASLAGGSSNLCYCPWGFRALPPSLNYVAALARRLRGAASRTKKKNKPPRVPWMSHDGHERLRRHGCA